MVSGCKFNRKLEDSTAGVAPNTYPKPIYKQTPTDPDHILFKKKKFQVAIKRRTSIKESIPFGPPPKKFLNKKALLTLYCCQYCFFITPYCSVFLVLRPLPSFSSCATCVVRPPVVPFQQGMQPSVVLVGR